MGPPHVQKACLGSLLKNADSWALPEKIPGWDPGVCISETPPQWNLLQGALCPPRDRPPWSPNSLQPQHHSLSWIPPVALLGVHPAQASGPAAHVHLAETHGVPSRPWASGAGAGPSAGGPLPQSGHDSQGAEARLPMGRGGRRRPTGSRHGSGETAALPAGGWASGLGCQGVGPRVCSTWPGDRLRGSGPEPRGTRA